MKKLVLLLFLIPVTIFSQGKLDKAKESLSRSSSSNSRERTVYVSGDSNNNSSSSYSIGDDLVAVFVEIGLYATVGVLFGEAHERDMNPYPYFYDNEGEYAPVLSDTGRKTSFKLGSNVLFNNVSGLELNALFKPLPILGIEASHTFFSEKNISNEDVLGVTTVTANYYRVREKNISLWWGAGLSYVGNGVNTTGFAYTAGTEVYPGKPISLHVSWKQSFINESSVDLFKGQVKYHIKNKAFYLGYHSYNLGNQKIAGPAFGFEYLF